MINFSLEEIREGLKQCLINKNCKQCPYYKWYYNKPNENSCLDLLYKDIDLILIRFSIIND